MNYQEALEYVEGCKQYGIVPGLDSIRRLLKKLGNPQEELKYVHIAGTNGKGSVLAMLSSVLSRAVRKTAMSMMITGKKYVQLVLMIS